MLLYGLGNFWIHLHACSALWSLVCQVLFCSVPLWTSILTSNVQLSTIPVAFYTPFFSERVSQGTSEFPVLTHCHFPESVYICRFFCIFQCFWSRRLTLCKLSASSANAICSSWSLLRVLRIFVVTDPDRADDRFWFGQNQGKSVISVLIGKLSASFSSSVKSVQIVFLYVVIASYEWGTWLREYLNGREKDTCSFLCCEINYFVVFFIGLHERCPSEISWRREDVSVLRQPENRGYHWLQRTKWPACLQRKRQSSENIIYPEQMIQNLGFWTSLALWVLSK